MIIKPKVRGFVCVTAHPTGCAAHIQQQIDYVKSKGPIKAGPKKVLVIGASTGFGLSSRITAAFGSGAATLGIFFERPSEEGRPATQVSGEMAFQASVASDCSSSERACESPFSRARAIPWVSQVRASSFRPSSWKVAPAW